MAGRSPVALLLWLAAAACGGSSPSQPPEAPVITVTGVADNVTYPGAVTITIAVDRGSYEARLDGMPFISGSIVSAPGAHLLVVTASASGANSQREIAFTIAGPPGGALIIRMLNLGANASGGGGDAILITDSTAARRTHALIDAGPAGENATNPAFVAQRLEALGVDTLVFLLLTHAHRDHFDGIPSVLTRQKVIRFLYNGQLRNLAEYNNMLAQAAVLADSMIVPAATREIRLGTATDAAVVTLVPALPDYLGLPSAGSDSVNNGSIGAELRLGGFRVFFTGDGEVQANTRWRTQFPALTLNLTVLKVGHHGANDAIFDDGFSGSSSWLAHTAPEVSIISANGTTHPRSNALTRLLQQTDHRTYCTNVHGTIEIRVTRTGSYGVTVERNADQDCVAGSLATT